MLAIKTRLGSILARLRTLLLNPAPTLLLAGILPLMTLAFSSEVRVVDDAYISYRYASNLVNGQGLVFNTGEYVEGFTNLLWTLIMAAPEALGFPVYLFAVFLGASFGLLALVGTWLICRQLGSSRWGAATAVVILGLYPDFWLVTANGLEGGLFALLLVCTVSLVFSGRPAYAGVCGGLLFMTRPDSALVIPICAIYLLVAPENRTLPLRQRIVRLLPTLLTPWIALVVAVTVWRLVYYGAWFPNTITAKSLPWSALDSASLWQNSSEGLLYWVGFLASAPPLIIGIVLAPIVGRPRPAIWLCLVIVVSQGPIVLANGGDWMPHYRLLAIYTPLLAVLLGMVVDRVVTFPRSPGHLPSWQTTILRMGVGGLLVVGCVFMLLKHHWNTTPGINVRSGNPCWLKLSEAVQPTLLPTDKVSPEALGTFSYMNPNVYSHDLLGLTDRYVARYGKGYIRQYGKVAPAYTYHRIQPNLIVVHSGFARLSPMARASKGTYNNDYSTYLLSKLNSSDCPGQIFIVSIRKDSVARILPAFAELAPRPVTVPG